MTHQNQRRWKLINKPIRSSSQKLSCIWLTVLRAVNYQRHYHLLPPWDLEFRYCRNVVMWDSKRAVTDPYLGGNDKRSFPHRTDHHQPISVQFWWHIHQPLWQHELRRKGNFVNSISSSSFINICIRVMEKSMSAKMSAFNTRVIYHKV